MTDKKLTDKEIIKALECCSTGFCKTDCFGFFMTGTNECTTHLAKNALDLINRLQAENEMLKSNRHCSTCKYSDLRANQQPCIICADRNKYEPSLKQNNIKAEAYKEFAERLKEKKLPCDFVECGLYWCVDCVDIDNLLKELVGE